jgi:hypothetical protein
VKHRFLREPLLFFFLTGALLFGADHWVKKLRGDGVIRVPEEVAEITQAQLAATWGRPPSESELKAHLQRWVNEEALFREGLRLGLERGDAQIRERVTLKTLNVLQLGTPIPEPTPEQLATWYDLHKLRYESPPRIHLQVLQLETSGPHSNEAQQRILAQLKARTTAPQELGKLAIYQAIPLHELSLRYSEAFTQKAMQSEPDVWTRFKDDKTVFFFNLERIQPGFKPDFQDIKARVIEDWRQADLQIKLDQRIADLVQGYRIEFPKGAVK